ncbi:hypothetical protein GJ496_010030 [Pomphorhynchus laevis]|nr:hypothetical protein GJ496_010030 [Pomphorhynchus laevis]
MADDLSTNCQISDRTECLKRQSGDVHGGNKTKINKRLIDDICKSSEQECIEIKQNENMVKKSDVIDVVYRYFSEDIGLTEIELQEIQMNPSSIKIVKSIDKLSSFLEKRYKQIVNNDEQSKLLVICGSARRCIYYKESLHSLWRLNRLQWTFAFSKHKSFSKQSSDLKNSANKPISIAFGTPTRVRQLIDNNVINILSGHRLFIVLDWTYRDVKLRTMTDMIELKKDLCELIKTCVKQCAQAKYLIV